MYLNGTIVLPLCHGHVGNNCLDPYPGNMPGNANPVGVSVKKHYLEQILRRHLKS
jgi:hypothetical protein